MLLAVTRRAVRRPGRAAHALRRPAGRTQRRRAARVWPWRPDRTVADGWPASGAIVATAVGIAGVLGVWSFESSRDRLVTEGRLFGADADMAWRGEPDDADRAVEVATSSPGRRGRRRALGPRRRSRARRAGRLDHRQCQRHRPRVGLGRSDGRPWQGGCPPGRGRPRSSHPRRARRRHRRHRDAQRSRRPHLADRGRRGGRVGYRRGRRGHRGLARRSAPAERHHVRRASSTPRQHVHYVVARLDEAGHDAGALVEAGFASVPLPSEIENLNEAGPLPWLLAGFLGALAVAGLLHALVSVLARPASRHRHRPGARPDDRRGAFGGPLGGGHDGRRRRRRRRAARDRRRPLVWAATAVRLGVLLEHALPWWAPVVTALGVLAVTLALAELPSRAAPPFRRPSAPNDPRPIRFLTAIGVRGVRRRHHRHSDGPGRPGRSEV